MMVIIYYTATMGGILLHLRLQYVINMSLALIYTPGWSEELELQFLDPIKMQLPPTNT